MAKNDEKAQRSSNRTGTDRKLALRLDRKRQVGCWKVGPAGKGDEEGRQHASGGKGPRGTGDYGFCGAGEAKIRYTVRARYPIPVHSHPGAMIASAWAH